MPDGLQVIESEEQLRAFLDAEDLSLTEFFADEDALEHVHDLDWLMHAAIEASIDRAFADVPNYKMVSPGAKKKLSGLMAHYAKMAHPFTQCVTDNTKRFGKDRAERICAVLKDLIRGTTKWRGGDEKKLAEFRFADPDARDFFLEWLEDVDERAFFDPDQPRDAEGRWSKAARTSGPIARLEEARVGEIVKVPGVDFTVEKTGADTFRTHQADRAPIDVTKDELLDLIEDMADRGYAEFETVDIDGIQLLSSGGPYFGAGSPKKGDHYADKDLQRIASNNNLLIAAGELHPFNKVGHNNEQRLLRDSGLYDDEHPATGDLRNFRVVKGKLLADAKGVPKRLAQLIQARAFPRRSIELKRVVSQKAAPGQKFDVVTAVGWLGAKAPAIRTLDDVAALYGDADRAFEGQENDLRFYVVGEGDRTFRDVSTKEREKLAKKGNAMPDGSYPIANEQDLRNAIQAIGRAKNPAAVKAHIRRRAKALGRTDLIPDSWGGRKMMELADHEQLAEARRQYEYREKQHPRGRGGRWIRKAAVPQGLPGMVESSAPEIKSSPPIRSTSGPSGVGEAPVGERARPPGAVESGYGGKRLRFTPLRSTSGPSGPEAFETGGEFAVSQRLATRRTLRSVPYEGGEVPIDRSQTRTIKPFERDRPYVIRGADGGEYVIVQDTSRGTVAYPVASPPAATNRLNVLKIPKNMTDEQLTAELADLRRRLPAVTAAYEKASARAKRALAIHQKRSPGSRGGAWQKLSLSAGMLNFNKLSVEGEIRAIEEEMEKRRTGTRRLAQYADRAALAEARTTRRRVRS